MELNITLMATTVELSDLIPCNLFVPYGIPRYSFTQLHSFVTVLLLVTMVYNEFCYITFAIYGKNACYVSTVFPLIGYAFLYNMGEILCTPSQNLSSIYGKAGFNIQ